MEKEKRQYFEEQNIWFPEEEMQGGKYLEKENILPSGGK